MNNHGYNMILISVEQIEYIYYKLSKHFQVKHNTQKHSLMCKLINNIIFTL